MKLIKKGTRLFGLCLLGSLATAVWAGYETLYAKSLNGMLVSMRATQTPDAKSGSATVILSNMTAMPKSVYVTPHEDCSVESRVPTVVVSPFSREKIVHACDVRQVDGRPMGEIVVQVGDDVVSAETFRAELAERRLAP